MSAGRTARTGGIGATGGATGSSGGCQLSSTAARGIARSARAASGGAGAGSGHGAGSGRAGPLRPGSASRAPTARAHDVGFDHHVARSADHQQMLDVVAADDDELAAPVDGGSVDHGEPRLAGAGGGVEARRAEPAHQPGGCADQQQDDDKCDDKVHRSRQVHAKEAFIGSPPAQCGPCGPPSRRAFNAQVEFAQPAGLAMPRFPEATVSNPQPWPKSLTPPAIIAAGNTNKELTALGAFDSHPPRYNDSLGKRAV